jgi:hypothetical protein
MIQVPGIIDNIILYLQDNINAFPPGRAALKIALLQFFGAAFFFYCTSAGFGG